MVLEHDDAVGVAQGGAQVVQHDQGGHAVAARLLAHQLHDVELVVEVQGGQGFVQQQHARFADQGLGQACKLGLAARQLIQMAHGQVGDAQVLKQGGSLGDRIRGGGLLRARGVWRGLSRGQQRFDDAQVHGGRQGLGQVDDAARALGQAGVLQFLAFQRDAALGAHQAGQGTQQGGLAAAVGPQHHGEGACAQRGDVQRFDDASAPVGDAETLDLQTILRERWQVGGCEVRGIQGGVQGGAHVRPRVRSTMARKKGMPTSEVTMPTGMMTPGISVLDATEASDSTSAPTRAAAGR
ncbi:hypothetical protein BW39_03346 [Delftia sp. RIT313]|nr:hypothetical protein BW39_03346 [Delftia sp. RIT313]